jgi:hypothetical protein
VLRRWHNIWVVITDDGSVLERHPIIMRDPETWEQEFWQIQRELMQHGKVGDAKLITV